MKKLIQKFAATAIAAVISVSAMSATVMGYDNNDDDLSKLITNNAVEEDGYIKFSNPDSRIASNGDFSFEIRWSVESDSFKFTSNKSTLTVSAHIEDFYTGAISYKEHLCTLYIENGLSRKAYDFYADGEEYTFDLANLKVGTNSKISISSVDYLDSTKRVVGSGNLANISVN